MTDFTGQFIIIIIYNITTNIRYSAYKILNIKTYCGLSFPLI